MSVTTSLPAHIIARIKHLYETHILAKLTAKELFDDAMYLFEVKAKGLYLSEEVVLLFRLASEKGHTEAAWIVAILEQCPTYDKTFVRTAFENAKEEKAMLFVYFCTRNKEHLTRAAATGWIDAFSEFVVETLSLDNPESTWLMAHGSRNARWKVGEYRMLTIEENNACIFERHPEAQFYEAIRRGDIILMMKCIRFKEFVLYDEYFSIYRNLTHGTDTLSALHAQYLFGKAMVFAGNGIDFFCQRASRKLPNVNYPQILSDAFTLYDETWTMRTSAIYTTMLVCRRYGLYLDLRYMIGQLIWNTFPAAEEWLPDEPSMKRLKRSEV